MNILTTLANLFRVNKATEGAYRPGPYVLNTGILPASWGKFLNFWQMDYDPVAMPGCSIVEACIWAYVRAIAQLPGYHKRELGNGGTEIVNTSALSRLLRSPNGYETPSDFLVHLIRSLLLTGNSYWIAQRNDRTEVEALHWTDPRECHVREIGVNGQAFREIFYEISDNPILQLNAFGRRSIIVPARDVLHIKLATPCHPLIGETWLKALSIELATRGAINAANATFSGNMSRPSGVLQTDMTLTKVQVDELRNRWDDQAKGMNAGGVPILTSGLKFQPIAVSNEDQQIIEQLKLNDQAIAAVFGVPAALLGIGGNSTDKSAEAVMAQWLSSGLGWLINHIELAFDSFIGLNKIAEGREWTEYDTRVLLRSLFRDRIDGLVRGVQGGIYSPNEARALEGYAAAKEGDEPRVQQQVVPLSAWDKAPAPAAPPAPAPAAANDDGEADDGEVDGDEGKALARFLIERACINAA